MFVIKQPLSGIWKAFATLMLSLNVRGRKGLNKRLSCFRRKSKEFLLAVAAPPKLGKKAGKAAPPSHLCSPRQGSDARKAFQAAATLM